MSGYWWVPGALFVLAHALAPRLPGLRERAPSPTAVRRFLRASVIKWLCFAAMMLLLASGGRVVVLVVAFGLLAAMGVAVAAMYARSLVRASRHPDPRSG